MDKCSIVPMWHRWLLAAPAPDGVDTAVTLLSAPPPRHGGAREGRSARGYAAPSRDSDFGDSRIASNAVRCRRVRPPSKRARTLCLASCPLVAAGNGGGGGGAAAEGLKTPASCEE